MIAGLVASRFRRSHDFLVMRPLSPADFKPRERFHSGRCGPSDAAVPVAALSAQRLGKSCRLDLIAICAATLLQWALLGNVDSQWP